MSSLNTFPSVVMNIATYLAKRNTTAQIKRKGKGYGIGVVDGIAYLNINGTAEGFAGTQSGVGTDPAVSGSVISEYMFGHLHRTTFTFTAVALTLADATVGAGVKIYTFPAGAITVIGAAGQVAETTTSVLASTLNTGVTLNFGLGSTTQANGVLATTEQNILQTSNLTASATVSVAGATAKIGKTNAVTLLDGHATPAAIYFNVGVATATDIDADATTTYTGIFRVDWFNNVIGN